jgi:REP element-mobilizing transposase RayT
MDRYLDTTRTGPMWLRQPTVADLVSENIRAGAGERFYELHAWVVMANHVHLLIRPFIEPREAVRRIKGRSAREANLVLRRTGEPFWQSESYDRWVRNTEEMTRTSRYIENNPVTAGLVSRAEDYRWSSAWMREFRVLKHPLQAKARSTTTVRRAGEV